MLALVEWGHARDPATKPWLFKMMEWRDRHGWDVLEERSGVADEDREWFGFAVSPRSDLFVAPKGLVNPSHIAMHDELARLRREPARRLDDSVLRVGFDDLTIRAGTTAGGENAIIDVLEAHAREGTPDLILGGVPLVVRRWTRNQRTDEFRAWYGHNFLLSDRRDGTMLARVGVGLIRSGKILDDRVRLRVTGQGCARGILEPLVAHVLAPHVRPDSISVDAHAAIDLDVPLAALMLLDVPDAKGSRRCVVYRRSSGPASPLGLNVELRGTRRAGSVLVYDKRRRVQEALARGAKPGARRPKDSLTQLAASFALPAVPSDHVSRIEVRTAGARGLGDLLPSLRHASPFVADLRRARPRNGADTILIVKAREHGLAHDLPSIEAILTHGSSDAAGGLGAAALGDLLRRTPTNRAPKKNAAARATRDARAILDRAIALVAETAVDTGFDLHGVLERALGDQVARLASLFSEPGGP